MRISDWSSDVCSSDLYSRAQIVVGSRLAPGPDILAFRQAGGRDLDNRHRQHGAHHQPRSHFTIERPEPDDRGRSEEHTSELQSLMRTPYAVSCLKKKKKPISQHESEKPTHTDTTNQQL